MLRHLMQRRLRTRTILYTVAVSITYIFVHVILIRENAYFNPPQIQFNYFHVSEDHGKLGFIVNTPNCHILNVSAWDKSIVDLLRVYPKPKDCSLNREWTYIDKYRNLVINSTALRESGFSLESISCCFKPFNRVHQNLDHYDVLADSEVQFSDKCHSMGKVTKLKRGSEFIRVFCSSKYWPWSLDVIYRNFHATPLPHKIHHKVKYWANKRAKKVELGGDPPNVLILGIDSMSRLSFQRNMPKTRDYLEKMGAQEMFGYTKLGENTFPNAIAFMTGLLTHELRSNCNFTSETAIDYCPFVWKDFDAAGYITSFIEDVPYLATYNYLKTGFVQEPVDYYFRPFMLGVQNRMPRKNYYYLECIGGKSVDEKIHGYIEDILRLSRNTGVPSFIYSWLTNLAHSDLNSAQSGDNSYLRFLQNLDLNNTLLFFMSDHGYRYGQVRQTFAGWHEDKLPNFWAFLPPKVVERFPNWEEKLRINSRRLSSPLDFHATLLHIIQSFSNEHPMKTKPIPRMKPPNSEKSPMRDAIKSISLFKDIPETRICAQAGIPDNFCACGAPKHLEINDTHLMTAAVTSLNTLNAQLPSQCARLKVESIAAGGILERGGITTYIVAFFVIPGSFMFEANVKVDNETGEYSLIGEMLRMNKINTDVSCVHDYFEKYCYCATK